MNSLIANESAAVAALCRHYGVVRLDLFGSATTGAFDRSRSDLDFVAEFADPAPTAEYADRFLDFADALETLLERRVDVVSGAAIRGSRLADEIVATRQLIYAEPHPAPV
ncbi:MAG: nucleotidyltransferase domain-containing protein [Phycisphaerales bacterium]|nr:nucleotidyltransferase domain-containing protein [Phycisphaerales bacterium]